jgi:transcriptional regulator with XRE-family HTH domain
MRLLAENMSITSNPGDAVQIGTPPTSNTMKFGTLLKDLRIRREQTLRACSKALGVDPSNWSKLERGVNPAPRDIATLDQWAAHFQIKGQEKQAFHDAAALSRNELPPDLASDETMLAALPAFFRAARGRELDEAKLRQFVEDVRKLHSRTREKPQ